MIGREAASRGLSALGDILVVIDKKPTFLEELDATDVALQRTRVHGCRQTDIMQFNGVYHKGPSSG